MTAALALAVPDDDDELASLGKLASDELRQQFAGMMGLTSELLMKMATIVRLLEERGEDTDDLGPATLIQTLRSIAYRQCLPEVVVRFSGTPKLMRTIRMLPLPDQKVLADGGTVELVVWDEHGKPTKRKADPLLMTQDQIRQVFAHDKIRSEAEQILILEQQRTEARRHRPMRVGDLEIDAERGGVVVKSSRGAFIPRDVLIAAVAALR